MGTTGVELALGLVPLIIAGVEAYSKTWDVSATIIHQRTKQSKHVDFLTDLLYEMRLFQMLLRDLVSELSMLSEEQKTKLLNHDEEEWRKETTSRALQERLHGTEDAFTEILDKLLKVLAALIRQRSSEPGTVDTTRPDQVFIRLKQLQTEFHIGGSWKERFMNRFRFAANEKSRKYSMLKITQCNEKLQKLLGQASRVPVESRAPIESGGPSRRTGPPLNQCRQLINALYTTMSDCWSCNCDPPHMVKLCLLRYFSTPEDDKTIASLDMLISDVPNDQNRGQLWRESHVTLIAEQKHDESHHTVTFQVNGEDHPQQPEANQVISLCSLVKEKDVNSVSIGIKFDGEALYRTKSRSRRQSVPVGEPLGDVQLNQLLETPKWEMSLRRKRILAVLLAHAVLNFCESPWMNKHWNKQHISFFKDSIAREGVDLARPYLSTIFAKGAEDSAAQPDFLSLHQSPPILALGVLLLELELCQPIEDQWQAQDMGEDGLQNSNTNLTAAQRLLIERVDDLYEGYRTAIDACLKCDFMTSDDFPSLDDDNFRSKIYDRIVAPLEAELEHCAGLSPNELFEKEMPPQVI